MANMIDLSQFGQPTQQNMQYGQPTNQPQMMMMRGGSVNPSPQMQNQQDPLGAAFMNMVQQKRGGQPEQGSLGAQFQLGKDYQNLGMDFQNAFSQTPQQVNPMAAFFMQNRPHSPQFNSFQNVISNQNAMQQQPPMGSIMGVGAQQTPMSQPTQQGGGFLSRGIFGGLY